MAFKLFYSLALKPFVLIFKICLIGMLFYPSLTAQPPKIFADKLEIIQFLKSHTAVGEFKEIKMDLTADGREEMLIGGDCALGQPCLYHIFKRNNSHQYVFSGTLLLFNLQFEVVARKSQGFCDILQVSVDEKKRHKLLRYEYDGSDYKLAGSIQVNSNILKILRPSIQ